MKLKQPDVARKDGVTTITITLAKDDTKTLGATARSLQLDEGDFVLLAILHALSERSGFHTFVDQNRDTALDYDP